VDNVYIPWEILFLAYLVAQKNASRFNIWKLTEVDFCEAPDARFLVRNLSAALVLLTLLLLLLQGEGFLRTSGKYIIVCGILVHNCWFSS